MRKGAFIGEFIEITEFIRTVSAGSGQFEAAGSLPTFHCGFGRIWLPVTGQKKAGYHPGNRAVARGGYQMVTGVGYQVVAIGKELKSKDGNKYPTSRETIWCHAPDAAQGISLGPASP